MQYQISSMNEIGSRMMSIKEQQDIQQILEEVAINDETPQLDLQTYQLLLEGESQIKDEYDLIAQQRLLVNRNAINVDYNNYYLHATYKEDNDQSQQHSQSSEQPSNNPQINTSIKPLLPKQYVLDSFEKEQLQKIKLKEDYIVELDSKYPKINYMNTNARQFDIFRSNISPAAKWFQFKKKPLYLIKDALIFNHNNVQWNIFNMGEELVVFVAPNWTDPIHIHPHPGKPIIKITKSPNNNFIALAYSQQILVYTIKKQTLILLKSINELKLQSISHINFYSQNPIKICFVDNCEDMAIITIEQAFIFTRVKVEEIQHQLDLIMDISITKVANEVLLAMASRDSIAVYTIQPHSQLICYQKISKPTLNEVSIRWRTTTQQPQLFIAVGYYVYIYKLSDQENNKKLTINLVYHNHYQITIMQIITNTHLLLKSAENLTVVAIPLIPTSQVDQQSTDCIQYFQSAICYVFCKPYLHIIAFSSENILFYVGESKLQVATLKTLQQQLQDMMIVKGCFRQAFSLLILISKGLNYSFKFSYLESQLSSTIQIAIHCAIDTLTPSTDRYIIIFRVGWSCQLAIDSNNKQLIWSVIHKKMLEINHVEVLFDLLQLFILRSQLQSIPQSIFYNLISYNCQLCRDALVEKIILDNPDSYDPIKVISILHNKQMYYLQCYLFSKGILSQQIDYYTPFLKIYSAFKSKHDNKTGLACLWLLYKCFSFEQIPRGAMSAQQRLQVCTNFLVQVLQPTIIATLYAFNQQILLQIFLLPLLYPQFSSIIAQHNSSILTLYNSYYQPLPINNITNLIIHSLPKNHTSMIWSEFAGLAFYAGCQIKQDTLTDILIIFFENKKVDYTLQLSPKLSAPTFYQLQLNIVTALKPYLLNKKNRVHLTKLLSFDETAVSYMFYAMDQNYKMAIENYLRTQPRKNIFRFVKQLINQINTFQEEHRIKKIKQIKDYFTRHITTLFGIDSCQALNTYYSLGFTTKTIYQIMDKNLYPKIDFLTAVLQKFKDEDFEMKDQYLLEHFSQACDLPNHQMLVYIDQFFYPLDQVITISEQKGNFLAKAIFEERNGRPQDAFKSYEKLIRTKVQMPDGKPNDVKKEVQQYVHHCIQICKQYSGSNDGNNFWIKMIRFLNSYIQSDHLHKVYLKVQFQRLLQYVLTQMFAFLPTSLLIDFFIKKDINLDLNFSRQLQIYSKIFVLVKFDISMLHRVIRLCQLDLKSHKKDHYLLHRSLISNGNCSFCQTNLSSQSKSRIYWCKHSFHLYCHDDETKCLSCYYQSDDSIILNAIFTNKKSKIIQPNQTYNKNNNKIDLKNIFVETMANAKLEQRKKKMKFYDFQDSCLTRKYYQQYFI